MVDVTPSRHGQPLQPPPTLHPASIRHGQPQQPLGAIQARIPSAPATLALRCIRLFEPPWLEFRNPIPAAAAPGAEPLDRRRPERIPTVRHSTAILRYDPLHHSIQTARISADPDRPGTAAVPFRNEQSPVKLWEEDPANGYLSILAGHTQPRYHVDGRTWLQKTDDRSICGRAGSEGARSVSNEAE